MKDEGWEVIFLREEHSRTSPSKGRLFWVVKRVLRLLRLRRIYAQLGNFCHKVAPLFEHLERKKGILYHKTDNQERKAVAKAKALAARSRRRDGSKR